MVFGSSVDEQEAQCKGQKSNWRRSVEFERRAVWVGEKGKTLAGIFIDANGFYINSLRRRPCLAANDIIYR